MNNNYTIKYKSRSASNISEKRIAAAYSKGSQFDVDLVTSDEKIVSAHRFVLSLYSRYLAGLLKDAVMNGLVIIPLTNYTHEIVDKVVQLMYFREVTVPTDLTLEMASAIKFLKIDDTTIGDSKLVQEAEFKEAEFKEPQGTPPKRQTTPPKRQTTPPKQASAPIPMQTQQKPPQQKQPQPQVKSIQPQPKPPQPKPPMPIQSLSSEVTISQTDSYVAGKRSRSQSMFQGPILCSQDFDMADVQTSIVSANKKGPFDVPFYKNLTISKVPSRPTKPTDTQMQMRALSPSPVKMTNDNVPPQPQQKQQQVRPTSPPPLPPSNVALSRLMQNPALTFGVSGNIGQTIGEPMVTQKNLNALQPNELPSEAMETDDLADEIKYEEEAMNATKNIIDTDVELKQEALRDLFPESQEPENQ
ncbi:integrator complex subunit 3 homolog [Contarinia nasturtii]|uniref:integrator complex subunit 3 homolog n=1 Tax=Contarinia nasturtii TaxID=265458 RepID=UPI0012D4AD3A|nr:integrator complex subunit 3 homolog [Contarinia nasturtii]